MNKYTRRQSAIPGVAEYGGVVSGCLVMTTLFQAALY